MMRFAHSGYVSTPELQLASGYRKPPAEIEPPHWTDPTAKAAFQALIVWFQQQNVDAYSGVSVYLSRRYNIDLDAADKVIVKFGASLGNLQAGLIK